MVNRKEIERYRREYRNLKRYFYDIDQYEIKSVKDNTYEIDVRAVYWPEEHVDRIKIGFLFILAENSRDIGFKMGNAKLMKIKSQMEKEADLQSDYHKIGKGSVYFFFVQGQVSYSEEVIKYMEEQYYTPARDF